MLCRITCSALQATVHIRVAALVLHKLQPSQQSTISWRGQAGTERGQDRLQGKRCACSQLPGRAQLRATPLAASSPSASSRSAAANNLNSAFRAGGRNMPCQGSTGWGLETHFAESFISCRLPLPEQGERVPFRRPIMMQSAAVFACAISPSFLNCAILLAAVERLSFQQTACAGKLLRCCQWGSNTSQHSCCEISGSTRNSFCYMQLCW